MLKSGYSLQLDRATDLVCQFWFPFDQATYKKIVNSITSLDLREEKESKEKILQELRKDSSLYLLCLKQVQSKTRRVRTEDSSFLNSIFETATLEELVEAIKSVSDFKVCHDLKSASQLQSKRLSEMIIASNAAEHLSSAYEISNDVCYSSALIRQLGYTLLAWNYPKIYEKITSKPLSKSELDAEILTNLGFSASMLAFSVLKRFGLEFEYEKVFEEKKSSMLGDAILNIHKICEIGEALSRAVNPDIYRTAKEDYVLAEAHLAEKLGSGAIAEIFSKSDGPSSSNNSLLKDALLFGSEEIERSIERVHYGKNLSSKNTYLKALPEKEKELSLKVYSHLDPNKISQDALRIFTKELVPQSIFSSTVVYLLDPIEEMLYPSLIVGKPRVFMPRTVRLKTPGDLDILVSSLELVSPIKEDKLIDNTNIVIVASSFGDPTVGVFYVEIEKDTDQINVNQYFKAIRNLFKDSLAI